MAKNLGDLESIFDSLPESSIDPSEDSDEGCTPGQHQGVPSSTCRCFPPLEQPEVGGHPEKTEERKKNWKHNASCNQRKQTKGGRARHSAVTPSADDRGLSGKDSGPIPVTRVGLEEDYENDESCIIVENDLGDIPICGSPVLTSDLCQKDADARRKRQAFYKQMLCAEPKPGRCTAQDTVFEPLESPSQVLKLIHRFQTQINNKGEPIDLPEETLPMEVSGNASPEVKTAIKKPPRVFPKKSPIAKSMSGESYFGADSLTEAPRSDFWDDGRWQPLEDRAGVANEQTSMLTKPLEDHGGCDQEALEVIEQLDKSIEEVILSDEDLAKTVRIDGQGTGKKNEESFLEEGEMPIEKTEAWTRSAETSSEEDETWPAGPEASPPEQNVHCQTLTIDTSHLDKSAVSPILTDEGFADGGFSDISGKKDTAEECCAEAPRMTDASVNTDFDATEDVDNGHTEVKELPVLDQEKEVQRPECFGQDVVDIAAPRQFRDEELPADAKPLMEVPASKKQWQRGYPAYPVWPSKKLTNGHVDRDKDDEDRTSGSSDTYTEEASHRMSTATLDGAVVAHLEDSTAGFSTVAAGRHGHFVVVAIDFGTTFSGYAFSFVRDPDNIHIMRKWEGGDPGVINQKTLTTVLLTPDRAFHSVGFTARDHYHDLDTEEAKRWLYFDKFKMALHHNANLSKDTEIRATNGASMPAITVFAHVLRFFREHALLELSDQSATRILDEDVRWVITVPAIWRQPAKQFMRQAAYQSGIASPACPDQLLIALEPEAASIYCRKLKIHQLVSEAQQRHPHPMPHRPSEPSHQGTDKLAVDEMRPGTRYMVVDCGGGTVDITVHEMADKKGNLKELHKPNGGPCGSVMVDAEFENLLNDIFGADFMEQFKMQRPAAFVDLMMAFEARKRNVTPFRNNPSNVSLPFSFVDYYKKCKGVSVETAIKKFGRKDIRWSSQGMLRLEPSAMRQLFDRVTADIRHHIQQVLRATNHTVEYLFLVGGFAESQILQEEIRSSFARLKIIIPQGVSLAVLKGAVLYGREPTVVSVRRSRMTYGVGVLNRFVAGVHPRSKRIVKDSVEWCTDVFDRFVAADESVGLGDVVLRSYTPAMRGQTNIVLHVYCSEKARVSFITDDGVCRCGTLHLDLSDVRYVAVPKRREIQTRMIFGDTELKISALDVTTGKCVRAQLDFLNH